jgi:hypothetical protein
MKIFLDDERSTPEGWFRVYDVSQLIHMTLNHQSLVEVISLDNDLGYLSPLNFDGREYPNEGQTFCAWLEEKFHEDENFLPKLNKINIHSDNIVACKNMQRIMHAIGRRFKTRELIRVTTYKSHTIEDLFRAIEQLKDLI